jgi:hypothetical protein
MRAPAVQRHHHHHWRHHLGRQPFLLQTKTDDARLRATVVFPRTIRDTVSYRSSSLHPCTTTVDTASVPHPTIRPEPCSRSTAYSLSPELIGYPHLQPHIVCGLPSNDWPETHPRFHGWHAATRGCQCRFHLRAMLRQGRSEFAKRLRTIPTVHFECIASTFYLQMLCSGIVRHGSAPKSRMTCEDYAPLR